MRGYALLDRCDFERMFRVGNRDTFVDGSLIQILDADAASGKSLPGSVQPVTLDEFVKPGMPYIIAAFVHQFECQGRGIDTQLE